MRAEDVAKAHATPLTAPPYPLVANRFVDREYLNITYRTDAEALATSASRCSVTWSAQG